MYNSHLMFELFYLLMICTANKGVSLELGGKLFQYCSSLAAMESNFGLAILSKEKLHTS